MNEQELEFTHPDGRTIRVKSPDGSVPSEQEIDQMFESLPRKQSGFGSQYIRGVAEGLPSVSSDLTKVEASDMVVPGQLPLRLALGGYESQRPKLLEATRGTEDPRGMASYIARSLGRATPDLAMLPVSAQVGAAAKARALLTPVARRIPRLIGSMATLATQSGARSQMAGEPPESVAKSALRGAATGAVLHGTTSVGAKGFPLRPKLGGALGGALSGGVMGVASGKPIEEAAVGALFGGLTAKGENPYKIREQSMSLYKTILPAPARLARKVELERGRKMDDVYEELATEQTPIIINKQGIIDAESGIDATRESINSTYEALTKRLHRADKQYDKWFDLEKIKSISKRSIRSSSIPRVDVESREANIDAIIDAEIAERGRYVSPAVANKIKQSMWKKKYDAGNSTLQQDAGTIGRFIKEKINRDFKGSRDVSELNKKIAIKADTIELLEGAHGKQAKPSKGRLGVATIVGALAGAKVPILGPIAGAYAGRALARGMTSPSRALSTAETLGRRANEMLVRR